VRGDDLRNSQERISGNAAEVQTFIVERCVAVEAYRSAEVPDRAGILPQESYAVVLHSALLCYYSASIHSGYNLFAIR